RQALAVLDDGARQSLIEHSIAAVWPPPAAATAIERKVHAVETARLARLLAAWLDFELTREPFTVVAVEEPMAAELDGLPLRTRIDRIDRLADGTVMIIDYKTGRCRDADWRPPRMNEPQLPAYAVLRDAPDTAAIAFAR